MNNDWIGDYQVATDRQLTQAGMGRLRRHLLVSFYSGCLAGLNLVTFGEVGRRYRAK